ncbi:MAG TPA: hypothetical protein VKB93_17655 [Thermoanaerobaculia bacterium]|nr:hypothetical protein [Thermoanaerobaculia bacterium]
MANHEISGPYARDDHEEGLGDEYARDGGWSGGGRADNYTRDVHPPPTAIEPKDVEEDAIPPRE